MDQPVILSPLEQEYLLRAIEAAVQVRELRQLFLWCQGQLQGLLPHELIVCMQFDADGALLRTEALHGAVIEPDALHRLCDARTGLAPRIAALCGARQGLPCSAEAGAADGALAPLQHDIARCGYGNLLVHGNACLPGGATMFVLFGMPQRPGPRQAYFMELLLPYLHLALLRVAGQGAPTAHARAPQRAWRSGQGLTARPLSAREVEILVWLREGKSNADIGAILGISALTVKNHLQRIYRMLAVGNRTQAVSRSTALRLLPEAIQRPQPGAQGPLTHPG